MNLETQWVVGFIDGEGCFYVRVFPRTDMTLGFQIQPELTVTQHEQDRNVLYGLKEFFKCGTVKKNHATRQAYNIKNLHHFLDIIIPFFEKHPLKTKRNQEFETFRTICLMMKEKKHLDPEGIKEVIRLAAILRVQTEEQKASKTVAKPKRQAKNDEKSS
jgi:hypothetical protein